jgi:N-acyl-L-homoserine lactone synthetase
VKYEVTTDACSEFYRLRALVFAEQLRWDVHVQNGEERDEYDPGCTSVLVWDDDGALVAGLRATPSTGPTLMEGVFRDAGLVRSDDVWECSRVCYRSTSKLAKLKASLLLNEGVADLIEARGITALVGNFDAMMLALYRAAGFKVDIVGETEKFGPRIYLGRFQVSRNLLEAVNEKLRYYIARLQ